MRIDANQSQQKKADKPQAIPHIRRELARERDSPRGESENRRKSVAAEESRLL